MITTITEFIMPQSVTLDEARNIFLSTAPNYRNAQGLLRKTYICSEDGKTLGGLYLWRSRQDAEAMYTEEWYAFVREKYATEPKVTYFNSPVIVDNVSQEVITD